MQTNCFEHVCDEYSLYPSSSCTFMVEGIYSGETVIIRYRKEPHYYL